MDKIFKVEKDFHNSRLDKWFKRNILDLPHSLISKLVRIKKIKVNNLKTTTSYKLQKGDLVKFFSYNKYRSIKKEKKITYKTTKFDKKRYDQFIVEDNENFLVLNKPSGVPVQGGTKSFKNIVDILKSTKYFKNSKPYIVHRIDKDTSGLLIVAKNRAFAQLFTSLFRIRKIHKTYHAIVHGKYELKKNRLIDDLITYDNKKKIVQKAITDVRLIKRGENFSLLELNPITGRKHQIRKQLLNVGHSIVGDKKYFSENKTYKYGLMLHAQNIKFMINEIKYNYQADYTNEFVKFLTKIKEVSNSY